MQCLQEPQEALPEGGWLCPKCARAAEVSGGRQNAEAPVRIVVGGKELKWVKSLRKLDSQFDKAGSLDTKPSIYTLVRPIRAYPLTSIPGASFWGSERGHPSDIESPLVTFTLLAG